MTGKGMALVWGAVSLFLAVGTVLNLMRGDVYWASVLCVVLAANVVIYFVPERRSRSGSKLREDGESGVDERY